MTSEHVHLHVHTEHSLLASTIGHDALVCRVRGHGSRAVAITEQGTLFGAVSFRERALAAGIKPILGCELYVAPGSRFERTSGGVRGAGYHLPVLAADPAGWANLRRLVTKAHLEGFYCNPRVDFDSLERHAEGLIALSGCLASELCQAVRWRDRRAARDVIDRHRGVFGDRYYLEIQRNEAWAAAGIDAALVDLARETGVRLVATNDCHYVDPEDAPLHDLVAAIRAHAPLDDRFRPRLAGRDFGLRSPDEMARLFADLPESLASTLEIAERCELGDEAARGRTAPGESEGDSGPSLLAAIQSRVPGAIVDLTPTADTTHDRDGAVHHLEAVYGRDRVAEITRLMPMTLRDAVHGVGRALGFAFEEIERFARLIPVGPGLDFAEAIARSSGLAKLARRDERLVQLVAHANRVLGRLRYPSIERRYAVVGHRSLIEDVPLYSSIGRRPGPDRGAFGPTLVTQFTLPELHNIGFMTCEIDGYHLEAGPGRPSCDVG